MCGILACLHYQGATDTEIDYIRNHALKESKKQRHRGPDWSGYYTQKTPKGVNIICHERLSIIDPSSGAQPLFNTEKTLCLSTNGEIYNHVQLKEKYLKNKSFQTHSDCEVIVHLYEKLGIKKTLEQLDGMFTFVIADEETGDFVAARDPIGITPCYYGHDSLGCMWISSEMKCINNVCHSFDEFPPGHYYDSTTKQFIRYYQPVWWNEETYLPPTSDLNLSAIRKGLEAAVAKRMMSDVPYGVLLSGGLDSSLTAAIASRYVKAHPEKGISKLNSFSIGLEGSPDLAAAKKVAEFLGTIHHGFVFTLQEGLDALTDVIYHLETYDVTSIRASTPMYLMSRKIKAMGIKMVLSGEGADEVYGGYLYFHKAPSKEEFHKETVRKLKDLHSFDCNRANKATSAWGLEARVPFLDRDFLDLSMTIDPRHKMIDTSEHDSDGKRLMEKYIIRKAFDDKNDPYLPEEVLWRQKEQFSDGVGYGWIDRLKDYAEKIVSDESFRMAAKRFPINTPTTKEGYLYRQVYQKFFPQESAAVIIPGGPSVACSTATAAKWCAAWEGAEDPSGRAVGVHVDAYDT